MRKVISTFGVACAAALIVGCHRSPSSPSTTTVTPVGGGSPSAVAVQAVNIGSGGGARSLAPGGTLQLTATARRSDGSEQDVTSQATWSSDRPSVATVSSAGLVTGQDTGTAHITASYQGTAGDTTVDVAQTPAAGGGNGAGSGDGNGGGSGSAPTNPGVPGSPAPGSGLPPTVQSVTISGGPSVPLGQTMQLRATAHMSDGSEKDVTGSSQWSMSNPIVAAISQNGLLTGIVPGNNVATAQYNGTSGSQPVAVTPF